MKGEGTLLLSLIATAFCAGMAANSEWVGLAVFNAGAFAWNLADYARRPA